MFARGSIVLIQFLIFINYLCHPVFIKPIQTPDDCDNFQNLKTEFKKCKI